MAINKTSVVLNTKGKSDVPFEIEVALSSNSTNCRNDLFSNPGEVRDNAQIERMVLEKDEFTATDIEDVCDELDFNFHGRTLHSQNRMFLTDKTLCKSNYINSKSIKYKE